MIETEEDETRRGKRTKRDKIRQVYLRLIYYFMSSIRIKEGQEMEIIVQ